MKIIENYNQLKWRNMGFGQPKVGDYIQGMVQDANGRSKQVVLLTEEEIDIRKKAFILQLIEGK